MNNDQIKSAVRWLVTSSAMYVAGWFSARGYLTYDTVMAILNSETFISVVVSIVTGIIGLFAHTQLAKLNAVAAMPQVEKVVVTSAVLARDTPSAKVTSER